MYPLCTAAALAAFLTLQGVYAALDVLSSSNIAVYWGQNSYGDSSGSLAQQNLAYYCKNSGIDVIQLAFLDVVNGEGGAPEINFANSGDSCTTFAGTALLECPAIGEDIVTCQSLGKTILLSIGDAAVAGAKMIWKTFGPVSTDTSIHRPFGKAVVDGFDFDFESTVTHMPSFGNELRRLFTQDTSKTYYLTAAPQCVYPDAADNPMLDGAVYFDAIWVQFYNNDCGIDHFMANSMTQTNFNFASWNTWATTISQNKDVKVLLGIPGGSTAAGTGFESASTVALIVDYIVSKGYKSFGGVMVWDASEVYANYGFLTSIASYLPSPSTSIQQSTSTSASKISITTKPSNLSPGTQMNVSNNSRSKSTGTFSPARKASTSTSTSLSSTPFISMPRFGTVTERSTKAKFATMAAATTASVLSTCPVVGETCATSGTYRCNGSSFGICANGVWIIESCESGLICVQDESLVYCDYKNDHPDTTCT
ncbi:class III chitinase [Penicillium lividum]|nr:class III chitinase [Penicillium lividum]